MSLITPWGILPGRNRGTRQSAGMVPEAGAVFASLLILGIGILMGGRYVENEEVGVGVSVGEAREIVRWNGWCGERLFGGGLFVRARVIENSSWVALEQGCFAIYW